MSLANNAAFAVIRDCGDNETLGEVLHKLDEPSLSKLIHDHEHGRLEQICGP
jgi:hypothetical protein